MGQRTQDSPDDAARRVQVTVEEIAKMSTGRQRGGAYAGGIGVLAPWQSRDESVSSTRRKKAARTHRETNNASADCTDLIHSYCMLTRTGTHTHAGACLCLPECVYMCVCVCISGA